WLSTANAIPAEGRLYDRLFAVPVPGSRNPKGVPAAGDAPETGLTHAILVAGEDEDEELIPPVERNYLDDLNPASKRAITAWVEAELQEAVPEDRVQFERHGYFVDGE